MRDTNWNNIGYWSNPEPSYDPDPSGVIEDRVEQLMKDGPWVVGQFEDGVVPLDRKDLLTAFAKGDEATVGKIMIELLRDLAYKEAEEWVDNGGYADSMFDGP